MTNATSFDQLLHPILVAFPPTESVGEKPQSKRNVQSNVDSMVQIGQPV